MTHPRGAASITSQMVFLCLSIIVGAVTFTGSLVACAKLDDLFKSAWVPAWLHLACPLLITAMGLVTGLASYYRPASGRDLALLQVGQARSPAVRQRPRCGPARLVSPVAWTATSLSANRTRCRLSLRSSSLYRPLASLTSFHCLSLAHFL
jgi:hypothetical protein